MNNFDFLDSLEDIMVEQFEVLNEAYARDMAKDILVTLTGNIEHENEVRYLLIDGKTGQLESRRQYQQYQEACDAIKAENLTHCMVGTLIVEGT